MTEELPVQRGEVSFVGAPPARQIERALGVSEVEIDGPILRCLVCGSFQPFSRGAARSRGHQPQGSVDALYLGVSRGKVNITI